MDRNIGSGRTPKKKNQMSRAERTELLRQNIIHASVELFIEQGYEKTTTRQILQRVGILNGSLYNIYDGKDDIFSDIAEMTIEQIIGKIDECLPEDAPFEEKLCFPVCLQIYASGRSSRVAELLSIAHGKWEIHAKLRERYCRWYEENSERLPIPVLDDFSLRIDVCSGAGSMIIDRMLHEPGSVDERDAMVMMCHIFLRTFGLSDDGAEGYVEDISSALSANRIVICGIEI